LVPSRRCDLAGRLGSMRCRSALTRYSWVARRPSSAGGFADRCELRARAEGRFYI